MRYAVCLRVIVRNEGGRKHEMSYEILKRHREIWQKKKVLRDIYHDWYRLIIENMADNRPALEIGSGGGNFKEFFPDVISSDYTFC